MSSTIATPGVPQAFIRRANVRRRRQRNVTVDYLGGIGSITPSDTANAGSPWISAIVLTVITPDYFGVEVRPVPVPAAAWLLLSALGTLVVRSGDARA